MSTTSDQAVHMLSQAVNVKVRRCDIIDLSLFFNKWPFFVVLLWYVLMGVVSVRPRLSLLNLDSRGRLLVGMLLTRVDID